MSFADSWKNAWDGGLNQLRWLRGTVGNFGWLNTPLAPNVTDTWLFVAAGLLLLALLVGTVRERGALIALGFVIVVLPTLIAAIDCNRYGAFWQGRYTMPISLGIVLLAGASIARFQRRLVPETVTVVIAAALAAVAVGINIIGFVVALSRYSVGVYRAVSVTGPWQPPLGGPAVTALEAACLVALAALAMWPRNPVLHVEPSPVPGGTFAATEPARATS